MDTNNIRNIIILKNLPSNIIDEAIVVLKNNEKLKNKQFIEKKYCKNDVNKEKQKNYIVKEAEEVIVNYISNIEKQKSKQGIKELEIKYKKLKLVSLVLATTIILISFLKII